MVKDLLEVSDLDLTVLDGGNRNILQVAELYDYYDIYKLLEGALKSKSLKLT